MTDIKFWPSLFLLTSAVTFAGEKTPITPPDLAPSAKAVDEVFVPVSPGDRWTLGGGLHWRHIGRIDFDTGPTNLTLPSLYGGDTFSTPSGIGPATGFANRSYDDGFVFPDDRTPNIGRTTHYGYQTPSQLQNDSLIYTATGGERRVVTNNSSSSGTGWNDDRDWELSPYLKLSHLSDLGKGWRAGPAFHFSLTRVDGGQRGLNTLTGSEQLDISSVSATDTYDTTQLVLPQAPYTGAPNIVAPLLPAVPTSRAFSETPQSTDLAVWNDSIAESLDLDLWGVSFGGEVTYQASHQFFVRAGAGIVINVADWDAKRSDTLYQSVNNTPSTVAGATKASKSGTDLLLGVYLEASAGYQITRALSIEANARYDWTQSLDDTVGNSSFDVDLSGLSLGIGATYTFW